MSLLLNKIIPFFVLPMGFGLLLILAGLIVRRRLVIAAGFMVLWLFSMPPVGTALLVTLEGPPKRLPLEMVESAAAVVVLSGMLQMVEGAPLGEWGGAVDRFEAGVELWQAGKAPYLAFTGGWVAWRPEAPPEGEILAVRAQRLGVPADAILITGKVGNTAAEAVAVRELLRQEGKEPRVILVTSAFHMPRAALLFQQAGLEVQRYPVDFSADAARQRTVMDLLPTAGALSNSERALREYLGRAYYRLRPVGRQ